jgi:hypothetical protein
MGLLLKFILFGLVFYYILKTVGGFVVRILGGQRPPQTQQRQNYQQPRQREGEINIDSMPNKKEGRQGKSAREGDYIDYEEVK